MTYMYDRRIARGVVLDLPFVEALRKDFLTLMKNLPRLKNYHDADKLRDAFKVFSKRFDEIIFQTFLNRDFKYDRDISDSSRSWYDKHLRKSGWSFYTELSLPMGYADHDDPYRSSEEALFQKFEEDRDRWANRLKDKARDFWNDMKEFFESMQRQTGKPNYTIQTRDRELVEMEGFKVLVVGFDPDYADEMERFKEGLRLFRRRAAEVFPPMLHHILPIHLNGYATLDEGGRYEGNHIEIALTGFSTHKNPNIVAHVIAHEMGHHLFKTYLSDADRKFWYEAIRGDYEALDLVKVLEIWPKDMWTLDLIDHLKDKDPLLALQLDVIAYGGSKSGGPSMDRREDAEKLVAEGHPVFTMKHPVTGYAGKNAEEAFCETLGLLVGYGPAAVQPIIKHWLALIVPGVKVSHDVRALIHARLGLE